MDPFEIVLWMVEQDGPVRVIDVARGMGLSRALAHYHVKRLVQMGLVLPMEGGVHSYLPQPVFWSNGLNQKVTEAFAPFTRLVEGSLNTNHCKDPSTAVENCLKFLLTRIMLDRAKSQRAPLPK